MDRRKFIKAATGALFIPAAPAIIRSASAGGMLLPRNAGGAGSPPPPPGPLVAHITAGASSTTTASSSAIDTTNADFILFSVNWFSSANILTVADSISSTSNIWTLDKAETETSTLQNALYVCATPTVGTGHTFSVSTTAPGYPSFEVAAFTWGSTLTAFSSNGATSSTPATSADFGSVTNGGAPFDAYLFSTFAFNDGGSGMSGFSIGGGATITDTVPMAPGVNFGGGIAFQKVTGFTGSWGPTWSWSNNSAALAGISIGFS